MPKLHKRGRSGVDLYRKKRKKRARLLSAKSAAPLNSTQVPGVVPPDGPRVQSFSYCPQCAYRDQFVLERHACDTAA
jgi:hypothetical protein